MRNTYIDKSSFIGIDFANGTDMTAMRKPVRQSRIKAIQFTGNFEEIEEFCGGDAEFRDSKLVVATPKGPLWVAPKEWIVRTIDNNFYTVADGTWSTTKVLL